MIVQLQIAAKGNEWYSYEFTVYSGGDSICDFVTMSDEQLLDRYFLWSCEFGFQNEVMGATPPPGMSELHKVRRYLSHSSIRTPGTT